MKTPCSLSHCLSFRRQIEDPDEKIKEIKGTFSKDNQRGAKKDK